MIYSQSVDVLADRVPQRFVTLVRGAAEKHVGGTEDKRIDDGRQPALPQRLPVQWSHNVESHFCRCLVWRRGCRCCCLPPLTPSRFAPEQIGGRQISDYRVPAHLQRLQVSDEQMRTVQIQNEEFHPEWNYTIIFQ